MAEHPQLQRFDINFLYANGEPELHPMIRQTIKLNPKRRASLYWLVMGLDSFSIFSRPRKKPTQFPPVLLGWGAQNKTLDVSWADTLADWLTPDHLWLIENAGHLPMYEQPEEVNKVLEVFFQSHEAS